ncbi:patatin-like phospholipase family protein [Puerhibacterium puerhi]|uniref:patatin-like phospholipase family protein n=1 Tax=Puerhibacterium puerhi TaxID=2692623 RepID=UPI0013589A7F|nr:patatin-like phospholipase family protein [Puerhibacterium puerhi]
MNAPFPSAAPSAAEAARPHQDQSQVDAARGTDAARERALVLGGGGSAGNAWLIGVLAGLSDGGLDVTQADLVVGTSAGATAAAQIAGAAPSELLAAILSEPRQQPRPAAAQQPRPAAATGGRGPASANHMERTGRIIAAAGDVADMRRRLGASALELDADDSWSQRWRATVAARLPGPDWPQRPLLITAVDARTGEPVVFDRHSGVDLVDAVAASTSSGLPYAVGDDRYLDGAYRRNENADLAAGYERVLVLSPLGGRTRMPLDWGMQLAVQADELRASGSQVETVLPDSASLSAFGSNLMDLSTRPSSARAGYDQGQELAEQLAGLWR